jgi:glycosyltransferase involved in cell wall biosynthesis
MIADHPDVGSPIDGGVQAVTSYLVDALSSLDEVELHVISFRIGLRRSLVKEHQHYVHHLLPFGDLGAITGFARDQSTLNRLLAEIRPNVVHSQGAGHHGILAIRCGYPSVMTIHGIHSQEAAYLSGLRRRIRTKLQGWMTERYCIRQTSHTILISPYVAEYYGNSLSGEHYLIPNPIDEKLFNVERHECPSRILFLGRLYALKGVRDLISAVSRLEQRDNVSVVLAGSLADERYVADLRRMINCLGMNENFQFTGILSFDAVLDELSKCACLVLPSYQETAPMVIQEAMASAVPVIASNICGIPYQIEHQKTGLLFRPGDIVQLREHLETILSSATIRTEYGAAAKQRASDEYRASAVAKKTLEIYRKIAQ